MKNMKKALCLFLALVMCLGMLPVSVLAAETAPEAVISEPKDSQTAPEPEAEPEVKPEVKPEAEPEDEPEVKPEVKPEAEPEVKDEEPAGEIEADEPKDEAPTEVKEEKPAKAPAKVPTEVKAFLDAVAAIPEEIDADNAEEAGELVNKAFDAYEALVDAGLDEYDGVADALAQVEAAYAAIDEALELESNSYSTGTWYDGAPLLGFGAAICFDPRNTTEFPKSDGTQISVIPWDFHNEKHAKDYYYYYDYRIGSKRTDPAPDPVQSSYFEKTYNWTNLDYYDPIEVNKSAPIGGTGRFGWRQGVTNFNDPAGGLVPTIPSVYLYRLEEITGEKYIVGGRAGIEFHASTEPQLESSGGPAYQPTGPYARIDVPVKADTPAGTKIQVRFRMAMGYDMEWQSSEGTYNWYVQDFILNFTVSEGGTVEPDPDVPEADVKKYHDLYIPAGGYSAVMSFSEFYYDYYSTSYCTLSNNTYVQGDEAVAKITGSELTAMNNTSRRMTYNDVTIQSAENAKVGDTTTLYATYTATSPYGASDGQETCLDVITVHIIEPREVQLDIGKQEIVQTLGKSADGTLSTNGTVFRFKEGSTSIVKGQNNKSIQKMTLTGVSEGTAVIERQYHYYRNDRTTDGADYLTTYVDVVNVTVGDPKGNDDPDTLDGLSMKKEGPATVEAGSTITYKITVKNDSGVDKQVTVKDILPYGLKYASSDPKAENVDDMGNVTWTLTVKANSSVTLTITCNVADDARSYLNNKVELTSENGDKLPEKPEHTVSTQVTTPTKTNPSLTGLTKERLTAAPAGVELTLPQGVEVNYKPNVVFVGDEAPDVTLLYKITVTGTAGAKYKVTDTGATWVGGEGTANGGVITGTIAENQTTAVIYVTKTFSKTDVKDGKLVNNATLESNDKPSEPGKPGTEGPTNGDASGEAGASKKYNVIINFKTDGGTELQDPSETTVDEGADFDYSVEQANARKARANSDVSAVVIPRTLTGDDGKTYALDEVLSAAGLDKLAAAKNITADVEADIIYSLDEKGTIGTDPETGKPTDTSDGIPDKYQVKVTFKVVNGAWNDETTADVVKYLVKYAAGGKTMATDGTATLGNIIPGVGEKPDTGYEKTGTWTVTEPTAETEITEDTIYTYTYTEVKVPEPEKVTITLTYDANGGSNAPAPDSKTVDKGSDATFTVKGQESMTRSNYRFTGWNTQPNGSGTAYSAGASITLTGDITLYAQWEYTGGGTIIPDDPTPTVPDPGTDIPDENPPLANVDDKLNTTDHFAYVIGYPDGSVRPTANITRAEAVTIFFRLLTDEYRSANWSTVNSYSDVEASAWYNNAISTATKAGIFKGDSEGTARPDDPITRAEFAALAARFISDSVTDDGTGDFADTVGHWAAKEIRLAAKAGWITGVGGGKFEPDRYINRAEVMTLVNRMLDRIPDKDHMLDDMIAWPDNLKSEWYYEAVQEATNGHDYERLEGSLTETWTQMQPVRDWEALEKEWSTAESGK